MKVSVEESAPLKEAALKVTCEASPLAEAADGTTAGKAEPSASATSIEESTAPGSLVEVSRPSEAPAKLREGAEEAPAAGSVPTVPLRPPGPKGPGAGAAARGSLTRPSKPRAILPGTEASGGPPAEATSRCEAAKSRHESGAVASVSPGKAAPSPEPPLPDPSKAPGAPAALGAKGDEGST